MRTLDKTTNDFGAEVWLKDCKLYVPFRSLVDNAPTTRLGWARFVHRVLRRLMCAATFLFARSAGVLARRTKRGRRPGDEVEGETRREVRSRDACPTLISGRLDTSIGHSFDSGLNSARGHPGAEFGFLISDDLAFQTLAVFNFGAGKAPKTLRRFCGSVNEELCFEGIARRQSRFWTDGAHFAKRANRKVALCIATVESTAFPLVSFQFSSLAQLPLRALQATLARLLVGMKIGCGELRCGSSCAQKVYGIFEEQTPHLPQGGARFLACWVPIRVGGRS
eukprot:118402-Pleurochrysis_carterae.AAC.2